MFLTYKYLQKLIKKDIDIYTFISDRSGRKTSSVQEFLFKEWIKNDRKAIGCIFRENRSHNISDSWFSEYFRKNFLQGYEIKTKKINDDIVAILLNDYIFVFGLYLSRSKAYKSNYLNEFETVKYMILEECVPEEQIEQNVNYVKKRSMNQIHQLLSINSTISRNAKTKVIMLGNDIEYNVINPATVFNNVLDVLKVNEEIYGCIDFENRKYNIFFLYFSFPNSVEHWKNIDIFDISHNYENLYFLNYEIIINKKTYFLHCDENSIYYIISKKYDDKIESKLIFNMKFPEIVELSKKIGLTNAVILNLENFNNYEIKKYIFFDDNQNVHFKNDKQNKINSVDLDKFDKLTLDGVYRYSDEFFPLYDILNKKNIVYDNINSKIYIEKYLNTMSKLC